ncbi:MAG: ATP phosphoribosyltransferase [Lentisphaeria bacterium]
MLKIAIPNKGALSVKSIEIIEAAGYKVTRSGRELSVCDETNDVDFLFLRPRDIAVYVANGIVELGITGRDLLEDSGAKAVELMPLGFGKSRFCYAVPNASTWTVADLDGKRIACSYPQIVKNDMARRGASVSVVKLDGAVEISVELGVADAIADVVESGSTMRQAGLKIIGEPVMESEAIVIGRSDSVRSVKTAGSFLRRLEGILVAQRYEIIEYDIAESGLKEACKITPGIESPTVAPLSKAGWFAVKSLIKREDVNPVIDKLEEIGADGIFISDIRTCRI